MLKKRLPLRDAEGDPTSEVGNEEKPDAGAEGGYPDPQRADTVPYPSLADEPGHRETEEDRAQHHPVIATNGNGVNGQSSEGKQPGVPGPGVCTGEQPQSSDGREIEWPGKEEAQANHH